MHVKGAFHSIAKQFGFVAQLVEPPLHVRHVREVGGSIPSEPTTIFKVRLADAQSQLDGKGRILVRYSGTEDKVRVMVEGPDKELITRIAESLRDVLRDEIAAPSS